MAKFVFRTRNDDYEPLAQEDLKENIELHTAKLIPEYEKVVERPIQTGETLRIIALNYRIPISELKRVNRLHKESEFHALNKIKIPIKANSALSEILEEEARDRMGDENGFARNNATQLGNASCKPRLSSLSTTEDSDVDSCIGYVSINKILREKSTRHEAKRFLRNMQEDLNRIKQKVNSDKGSLSEAAAALTDPRFVPLNNSSDNIMDSSFSWWRVFLCAIFFLLLLPIGYLIYLFHSTD